MANAEPHEALVVGKRLLRATTSPTERSRLLRCVAIAHRVAGDANTALATITQSKELAISAGDKEATGLALVTESLIVARMGEFDRALLLLDQAEPLVTGLAVGEAFVQRGLIALHLGRFAESVRALTDAADVFDPDRDQHHLATAYLNRAVANGYLGELTKAEADSDQAEALYEQLGDKYGAASIVHNRAWLRWIGGSAFEALSQLESAVARLEELGIRTDTLSEERCQALLAVGRVRDAAALARTGVAALTAAGNAVEATDMQTMLALTYERLGDNDSARLELTKATAAYRDQGRDWFALGAEVRLMRNAAMESQSNVDIDRLDEIIEELKRSRNPQWLGEAKLLKARALADEGRPTKAIEALALTKATALPLALQVEQNIIRARCYQQLDRPDQVLRNVRRAVDLISIERALVGAFEVRASMSSLIDEAWTIGATLLAARNRFDDIVALAEAIEGPAISIRSTPPTAELAEYRALATAIQDYDRDLRDTTTLRSRRAEIERSVRRHRLNARTATGAPDRGASRPALARDRDRVIVRFAAVSGSLVALVANGRRRRMVTLGHLSDVVAALGDTTFAVERALRGAFDYEQLGALLADLDAQFVTPLSLTSQQLFVIPAATGIERLLPFLPSLRDQRWSFAVRRSPARPARPPSGGTVLVEGTKLTSSSSEINRLEAVYDSATTTLRAEDARATSALAAMEGADLVHIVAHATLNEDDAMFSSVSLSDGPLATYDLVSLERPPRQVVLAACRSTASDAVGATAVGLTQGLLSAGVQSVVGTVASIPDDNDTVAVVTRMHEFLRDNPPSEALCATRNSAGFTTRQQLIAQCFAPWSEGPGSQW